MSVRAFLDTNVLVYLFDDSTPAKQQRARDILSDESLALVISTQVLSEFYVVVTRKLARPLPFAAAAAAVREFSALTVTVADAALVHAAIETSTRDHVSYWDAMIIESALAAGCSTLLTEDLHPHETRGLTIANPFAGE